MSAYMCDNAHIHTIHVYAEDGFESAHRSETAARLVAMRGSRRRGVEYRVVRCSGLGYTGGGEGTVLAVYRNGYEINSKA